MMKKHWFISISIILLATVVLLYATFNLLNIEKLSLPDWVSLAFLAFSMFLLYLAPVLGSLKYKESPTLSRPIYSLLTIYFVLIFISTFVIVKKDPDPKIETVIIIYTIITTLMLLCLAILRGTNKDTEANIEEREKMMRFHDEALSYVRKLQASSSIEPLSKIYDLLNSSPIHSNNAVSDLEEDIIRTLQHMDISDYENMVGDCEKIVRLINQRNSILLTSR